MNSTASSPERRGNVSAKATNTPPVDSPAIGAATLIPTLPGCCSAVQEEASPPGGNGVVEERE